MLELWLRKLGIPLSPWQCYGALALGLSLLTIGLYLKLRWAKLAPIQRFLWLSVQAHLGLALAALLIQFADPQPQLRLARGPVVLQWISGDGGQSLTNTVLESPGGGNEVMESAAPSEEPLPDASSATDVASVDPPPVSPVEDKHSVAPDQAAADPVDLPPTEVDLNAQQEVPPSAAEEVPPNDTANTLANLPDAPQQAPADSATHSQNTTDAAQTGTATDLEPVENADLGGERLPAPSLAGADAASPAPLEASEPTPAASRLESVESVSRQEEPTSSLRPGNDSADAPMVKEPLPWRNAGSTSPPRGTAVAQLPRQTNAFAPADARRIYANRHASVRTAAALQFGGSTQTEASVAKALDWLALVQSADGRWDADRLEAGREPRLDGQHRQSAGKTADPGITGLALLAFLGAGQTHQEGEFQPTVTRGLGYLLRCQGGDGSISLRTGKFESMYCHAIATLAVAEAYALTGDPWLKPGLEKAIQFTVRAQNPETGGWRYQPYRKAPDDQGDTSLLGWQLMALKAAERGGVSVDPAIHARIHGFLQSTSVGAAGGLACYQPGRPKVSPAMTAEALLCRIFLGQQLDPMRRQEALALLQQNLPGKSETNHYYWYYATLALHQLQGPAWEEWNQALQTELLASQRSGANDKLAGSWNPDASWGQYGGRVYSTALATLCLESYYRYVPTAPRVAEQPGNLH